jgi:hypothetical protein
VRRLATIVALALLAGAAPLTSVASAERVAAICASRIYDYLRRPVDRFAIDFRQTPLISAGEYARYRADLETAAGPLGFDPVDMTFTLHESLSAFPFLNRGLIREVILVLCAGGREAENVCRRGDYYVYDAAIDVGRLALMLADIVAMAHPAPVDSCEFGQGDWSGLDP